MKGLATQTIVLIVLALLVLGVVGTLIFLGVGPFGDLIKFNKCRGQLISYCQGTADVFSPDCAGKMFGNNKKFCSGGGCSKDTCPGGNPNEMNCCNVFG